MLAQPEVSNHYSRSLAELVRVADDLPLYGIPSYPSTSSERISLLPLLPPPRPVAAKTLRRPATSASLYTPKPLPPPPEETTSSESADGELRLSAVEMDMLFSRLHSRPPSRAPGHDASAQPRVTISREQERALADRLSRYQRPRPQPPDPHPRTQLRLPETALSNMTDRMHYEGGLRKALSRYPRSEHGNVLRKVRNSRS